MPFGTLRIAKPLQAKGIKMKFREANRNDIFEIVKMIAHDKLGKIKRRF